MSIWICEVSRGDSIRDVNLISENSALFLHGYKQCILIFYIHTYIHIMVRLLFLVYTHR